MIATPRGLKYLLMLAVCMLFVLSCSLGAAATAPTATPTQSAALQLTDVPVANLAGLPDKAAAEQTAGATLVYPNATVQIPPLPGSPRIQFQPGATSASVTGLVLPLKFDEWILAVKAGQTFSAQVTFSTGEASMTISGADGAVLQVDADRAARFNGILPTTQDYYIHVIGNNQFSTSYTLTVTLQ